MDEAAREHPNQPCVDRAEEQLAGFGALAGAGHVLQDPADLACRVVRVGKKPGLCLNHGLDLLVSADLVDHLRRAAALPHNRVVHGLPRCRVPDYGGLPLVVDADGVNVVGVQAVLGHQLRQAPELREEDLLRVVLDPSGLWEDLLKRPLDHVDHMARAVDEDRARARGSLVERDDVASAHLRPTFPSSHVATSTKTSARRSSFNISCLMLW